MSNDFQTIIDSLHRLNGEARWISADLSNVIDTLDQALRELSLIRGSSARGAERAVRQAQKECREVVSGWLESYVRRSAELCHRIAS